MIRGKGKQDRGKMSDVSYVFNYYTLVLCCSEASSEQKSKKQIECPYEKCFQYVHYKTAHA